MSSVFSIFTQPCSQEGIKKDVLKFSTQHENVQCQFQARNQYFFGGGRRGVFPEKSCVCRFLLNQPIAIKKHLLGKKLHLLSLSRNIVNTHCHCDKRSPKFSNSFPAP